MLVKADLLLDKVHRQSAKIIYFRSQSSLYLHKQTMHGTDAFHLICFTNRCISRCITNFVDAHTLQIHL